MADIPYTSHHHFPQGDASLLPSQRLFDDAFASARAELSACPSDAASAKPPMPCGFIALATAAALSCAPHTADDERVLEPDSLIRGIDAVVRAVLAERAAVISANAAPGALGKDVTPTEYLHAMMGQWEVADALRALASSPIGDGVRLCYLRAVHAADDEFFAPLSTDPLWVHDYFAECAAFRGPGVRYCMQVGGEIMPLQEWAARVRTSGSPVSPPFVVDGVGHYFVARIKTATGAFSSSAEAIIYDSIARDPAKEPLHDAVAHVVQAVVGSGVTAVWDFDCSLIDDNSDTVIPACIDAKWLAFIDEHRAPGSWTALMAETAVKMHAAGVSSNALRSAASQLKVDPDIVRVIRELDASGATQTILSDANAFYIASFLDAHDGFSRIFKGRVTTNPSAVDDSDCLRIRPFHDAAAEPHGCPRCPPNLCKGLVLESHLRGRSTTSRVFYIGDGGGDVCPCRRALRAGDAVFARAKYPLAKSLLADPPLARVSTWDSGAELRAALLKNL
jgi:pyridoxal phosphate phosphatase PHOSPHO2